MEKIIFESSYLLRQASFLEDLKGAVYLFNHSNCSHPSLESVFAIERTAILHSLKCTVPLSFVRCTTCCHLLSLIVIGCNSLPFVVTRCTTRCHSLSLVVTRCTTHCHSLSLVFTRCHSLSLDVPLVCFFINDLKNCRGLYAHLDA